jgi:hypothetical protein
MHRGHTFLEVARHMTLYGDTSMDNKSIQNKWGRPSWRKLYFTGERFREADLYTQSRFHDTLNRKYPSVEAYTKVLEVVLVGDFKPRMKVGEFKFDEVRPKLVASKFKPRHGYRKPPPKRMPSKGTWVHEYGSWEYK